MSTRANWADDYVSSEGRITNSSHGTAPTTVSDTVSKLQLYYQKLSENEWKMEQLSYHRNALIDQPYEELRPSEKLILDEYPFKLMDLQQDKRYWQGLIHGIDGTQYNDQTGGTVINTTGTILTGFERHLQNIQFGIDQPLAIPVSNDTYQNIPAKADVLPSDSVSHTPEKSLYSQEPLNGEPSGTFFQKHKKWILGLAVVLLLGIILAVVLVLVLPKPSSTTSSSTGSTGGRGTPTANPTGTPTGTPNRNGPPTSYTVTTFAGTTRGFRDGSSTEAQFNGPSDVAVDPRNGDIIVADSANNRIRRISNGVVTTIAGDGISGIVDGPAASARFSNSEGITVTATGDIFIADTNNNRIRALSNGVVRTVAGNGTYGYVDGPAITSQFALPVSLTTNRNGALFVADYATNSVRRIGTDNTVATFAKTGLTFVSGVTFEKNGNLLVTDRGAGTLFRVTPVSDITTVSTYVNPWGVVVDQFDTIIVAESDLNRITGLMSNGTKFLIAGSGVNGTVNGVGSDAAFSQPRGMAIDANGVIYVADHQSHVIRAITPVWN